MLHVYRRSATLAWHPDTVSSSRLVPQNVMAYSDPSETLDTITEGDIISKAAWKYMFHINNFYIHLGFQERH